MQSIPEHGHAKLLRNLAAVYPELAKKPFSASRLCWYSDRHSGDFLLDYHPDYNGTLFIGAGGSGHAFSECRRLASLTDPQNSCLLSAA